ncbi:hypothetical protein C0995_005774 [Termitomyces sp. Mi166|nr:hypothetical protein C0995_005774 [Termitomyces sp. Mi166\
MASLFDKMILETDQRWTHSSTALGIEDILNLCLSQSPASGIRQTIKGQRRGSFRPKNLMRLILLLPRASICQKLSRSTSRLSTYTPWDPMCPVNNSRLNEDLTNPTIRVEKIIIHVGRTKMQREWHRFVLKKDI